MVRRMLRLPAAASFALSGAIGRCLRTATE